MSLLSQTSILVACLIITGCSESPPTSQGNKDEAEYLTNLNDTEYIKNLRLHFVDKTFGVVNGVFEPKAELTLTNVGDKTVTSVKVFYQLDAGRFYTDSAVIEQPVTITPGQKRTISLKLPATKVKNPNAALTSRGKNKIEVLAVQAQ